MLKQKSQDYSLAFTHLQNKQNIAAYNQFMDLASEQEKKTPLKSALFYVLAAEAKKRNGKENHYEMMQAGKLYLNYAKKNDDYQVKIAYQCASKCFIKAGDYSEAKKAYENSKKFVISNSEVQRPVIIVDDSEAVVIKLQNYLKQLGYNKTISFGKGADAIKKCKKLIKESNRPIFLLDMGLPDVSGDVVASKILDEQLDSQIILITADEKTTERANKAISSGVTAFIQKPFTINDLKDAMDTAESEYSAL